MSDTMPGVSPIKQEAGDRVDVVEPEVELTPISETGPPEEVEIALALVASVGSVGAFPGQEGLLKALTKT